MPISKSNGFTALVVPYPSPDSTPRALPEFKVSQSGSLIESYIIAKPYLSFRVYFARNTEINDLECYLCVLDHEGRSACKAYGIGGEVVRNEFDNPWHISAQLTESVDIVDLGKKVIELKLVRTRIKEGVQLGNGELLVQDFKFIDDREFVLFRWFWCTSAQALELQLDPTFEYVASPCTDNYITNFLSAKEKLLVSLLTSEQRIAFLSQLTTSPTTNIYLSTSQKLLIDETRQKLEKQLLESESNSNQKSSQVVDPDFKSNAEPLIRLQSPTKSPSKASSFTFSHMSGTENQNLIFKHGEIRATSRSSTLRSPVRSSSINNTIRSPSPLKPGSFNGLLSSYDTPNRIENVEATREEETGQIKNRDISPDCMDSL